MRIFLAIVLITSSPASPVTLILGETTGENVITIHSTINNSLSDSSTTIYSGTIEADLTLVDQAITSFEMTGGRIFAENVTFNYEIENLFRQTVIFESLTAAPVSPNGPELLLSPGQFTASDHYFLFNKGCVVSTSSFGDTKTVVEENPFSAAGSATGTINPGALEEIRSSITNELIATSRAIEFVLPLNSTKSDGDGTFTLVTVTTGTVTAFGSLLEFAHPFYEWATVNAPLAGSAIAFASDANHDGEQDGISWALGFAPGAENQSLRPNHDRATGDLTFTLPGTTRALLGLEQSTSLAMDQWTPVPGFSTIPAGTTGNLVVTIEDDTTLFYRFTAILPE